MKLLLLIPCLFALYANHLSAQLNAPSDSFAIPPQIETPPALISKPSLEFPSLAGDAGLAGSIFINVAVGKDGKPFKTEITKREPEFVYLFDETARRYAMQCRFSPARDKDGNPLSVWISIPIRFKLRDFEPPVCLEQASPVYPKEALEMGMEGWVAIAVLVDELGTVIKGKVQVMARDPGYTKVFDDAAIDVARNSKYRAATNRGGPTKGWLFLKVSFKIPWKKAE